MIDILQYLFLFLGGNAEIVIVMGQFSLSSDNISHDQRKSVVSTLKNSKIIFVNTNSETVQHSL